MSTVPSGTKIATRDVTYSGDSSTHVAPVGIVTFSGSDDAKTATDVPAGGGVEAAALRVTIASDSTGVLSVDDNGGSLTVDGTVTANLAAGTNNIGDVDVLSIAAGDNNIGNVDIVTMPNVTLAASTNTIEVVGDAAHDAAAAGNPVLVGAEFDDTTPDSVDEGDVGRLRISANRNLYSTIRDAAGNERGANVNASNQLEVAVGNTVTVGSHAVTNAGTFAVQVDGSALTALQLIDDVVKVEDTAHSSGDSGVMSLAVRKDSGATLAGTDGDYAPLQLDSSGNLRVNIAAGAAAGGTSATDEAAYTPASSAGTPIMGAADETSPDAAAEGTLAIIRSTLSRALHVNLRDASGTEVSVGGGTQYDEDAAHSSGSKVTGCGIVRKDTAASLAGTDGDYTLPIADASGKLWTNAEVTVALPAGSNAIGKLAANSGVDIGDVDVTSVVPGTGATALGKAEDGAHTSGDVGVMSLAVRTDSPANRSGADGDYEPLQIAAGRLWASATIDAAIPAGTNNIGDVDILSIAAGDNNIGNVDVVTLPNVTLAAGTNTNEVVGDAAHDAASAGNPLSLGLDARNARATATSADGDATRVTGDRYGRVGTVGAELTPTAVQATASGNTDLVAAPSAGNKLRVHRLELSNSHATTALTVGIRFGAAGTIFGKAYLPAAGGAKVINLGRDYVIGADAEKLVVNLSAAGQVECTAYTETVAT